MSTGFLPFNQKREVAIYVSDSTKLCTLNAYGSTGQRLPVFIKDSTYHCFLFNIVNSLPYRLAIHTLSMEHERQCSARQPQQDIR